MFFHRYGKFTGGIDLPEEKQDTLDRPIEAPDELDSLTVMLNAPAGAAEAIVRPGQCVDPGQRLARGVDGAVDLFAPLGGEVRDVSAEAIELTRLQKPSAIPAGELVFVWGAGEPETLRQQIDESHLLTCRSPVQPLRKFVADAMENQCSHLVLNAMESQPFVTADHRLLVQFGEQVVQGLAILARAMGVKTITLAVEQGKVSYYQHLFDPAQEYEIDYVALPRKYPIGADNILLKVLTRREVPCGGCPADIGVAVTDAATCFAAYRWVACEQRLCGRVVTISGRHAPAAGNYFVPYGANCFELLTPAKPPFILGGPMVGRLAESNSLVTPELNAILAMEPCEAATAYQCIRCGWCRDHCPARLNVAMLNDLYELGNYENAGKLGALSCVDCGVCSYVCPARLPLARRVHLLKGIIRRMHTAMPLFKEPSETT